MHTNTQAAGERYSPHGRKILEELKKLNPDDPALAILARRIARTMTIADAGFVEGGKPLGCFLLMGRRAAPFLRIVEIVAEYWIGKPWDGTRPYIHVECNTFGSPFSSLAPLIGPLPADAYGRQPMPRLAQIGYPHFAARAAEKLKKLWSWRKQFFVANEKHLTDLGLQLEQRFRMEFELTILKEQERLEEAERKRKPFRSLVFFEHVDQGGPALVNEIIRNVVRSGKASIVLPASSVHFSHALVFFSIRDEGDLLGKSGIGFAAHTETPQTSSVQYERVRPILLKRPLIGGLVEDMAENIFIIGERTRKSQFSQTASRMDAFKERCAALGFSITFTEPFKEGFVEDTLDKGLETYTDTRLETGMQRHILSHLAQLCIAGKIRKGTELVFESTTPAAGEFVASVRIAEEGTEPIAPDSIEHVCQTSPEPEMTLEELSADPFLKKLHEDATRRRDALKQQARQMMR